MKVTPELLEKYYLGNCSEEESAAVEQWQLNTDAEEEVNALSQLEHHQTADQVWKELSLFIHPETRQPLPVAAKSRYKMLFRIAACLLLLAGTLLFYHLNQTNQKQETSTLPTYTSVKIPKGKKGSLVLPDGTTVTLNSESELKYPVRFATNSRKIYLSGEAYFKVAKDKARPFSIYTEHTITRVLGTVFNLKAYPHEAVTLNVEEGVVRFGSKTTLANTGIYTAGQQGIFNTANILTRSATSDPTAANWKTNKLVFNGQPLSEIIPVLERWYNVHIKLNNRQLSNSGFTGSFDNPSLSFVLDRMGYVMKFNYSIQEDTININ